MAVPEYVLAQDDNLDGQIPPAARHGMRQIEDQREGGEEECAGQDDSAR